MNLPQVFWTSKYFINFVSQSLNLVLFELLLSQYSYIYFYKTQTRIYGAGTGELLLRQGTVLGTVTVVLAVLLYLSRQHFNRIANTEPYNYMLNFLVVLTKSCGFALATIYCDVQDENVDRLSLGQCVQMTGIYRNERAQHHVNSFANYLEVYSISTEHGIINNNFMSIFSREQVREIACYESHERSLSLVRLLDSFCPQVQGQELAKTALLLAILGGSRNEVFASNLSVLLMGNRGTDRQQLLLYAREVTEKSQLSAHPARAAQHVLFSKDGGDGQSIEAGDLILADRSVVCIDSLDKLKQSQQVTLAQAMCLQSFETGLESVSADTTVIAGCDYSTANHHAKRYAPPPPYYR